MDESQEREMRLYLIPGKGLAKLHGCVWRTCTKETVSEVAKGGRTAKRKEGRVRSEKKSK